jgi:phosphohistidine phosphatase
MKYLTIIRHAKSSWDHPGLGDIDRPLNERGKNAILLVGKYLKEQKIRPDLILSSPATRALQTARGISEYVGYKREEIKIFPEIYFGDTQAVYQLVKQVETAFNDVFLFGHEPKLSSLIIKLTANVLEKFSTCSVYRISFDVTKWSDIRPGSGVCEFYVNPKLLGEK